MFRAALLAALLAAGCTAPNPDYDPLWREHLAAEAGRDADAAPAVDMAKPADLTSPLGERCDGGAPAPLACEDSTVCVPMRGACSTKFDCCGWHGSGRSCLDSRCCSNSQEGPCVTAEDCCFKFGDGALPECRAGACARPR